MIKFQIENFEDQDLRILVNRKELEDLVSDLTSRVAGPIEQALKMAELKIVCLCVQLPTVAYNLFHL